VTTERFERKLRTRGYELDQSALIPPQVWMRYIEHMRWEALTNHTLARLFADAHSMVVVAEALELQQDLGHGVDLWSAMWIGPVGRSSITFLHELSLPPSGKVVARATAVGAYLGPDGRSAALPDEVRALASDESLEAQGFFGARLQLEAPAQAWCHDVVVRPSDLDLLRHVNHANYLAYAEDARLLAAAAGGYGAASASFGRRRVRRAAVNYRQQALQGEALRMATWPLPGDEAALGFDLRREGETICQLQVELG
jgi:acyl-CoA thioesterase FadM